MRGIALSMTAIAAVAVVQPVRAQSSEEPAIRAAVEHYLQGHATGDGNHHRMVFHKEAKLFWIRDGQLTTRTSEEYAAGASGKPAPDEAQRKRWIESVDVAGNAAVAKVVLDYPQTRFTDYMSMLKINGEWKIVNKTFHAQPK